MKLATEAHNLDAWEETLEPRYGSTPFVTTDPEKRPEQFRDYRAEARPSVKEFYRLNHRHQTLDFVLEKKRQYVPLEKMRMGVWEAMEYLNQLVDDSDPDTDLSQIEHLLQTAEAIRKDDRPRWFVLTGLLHDLGKILCLWGEPQWAVVGDTFPVGCAFSEKVVFAEFFADNPDRLDPRCQSTTGIYEAGCGLAAVHLSWGHDEYLYHVMRPYLPTEGLAMIRYHSCYPIHREHAYGELLSAADHELLRWVVDFNQYDLYSKSRERPDVTELKPYYLDLISEYFPAEIAW